MSFFDEILGKSAESVEQLEKVAEAPEATEASDDVAEEGLNKLAADLDAAGRIMAEGYIARMLEKSAMEAVCDAPVAAAPKSKMEAVAAKIGKEKGIAVGGEKEVSVRAEDHDAMSGAKDVVNPADYRG